MCCTCYTRVMSAHLALHAHCPATAGRAACATPQQPRAHDSCLLAGAGLFCLLRVQSRRRHAPEGAAELPGYRWPPPPPPRMSDPLAHTLRHVFTTDSPQVGSGHDKDPTCKHHQPYKLESGTLPHSLVSRVNIDHPASLPACERPQLCMPPQI